MPAIQAYMSDRLYLRHGQGGEPFLQQQAAESVYIEIADAAWHWHELSTAAIADAWPT